jgi:hypothetical protein
MRLDEIVIMPGDGFATAVTSGGRTLRAIDVRNNGMLGFPL